MQLREETIDPPIQTVGQEIEDNSLSVPHPCRCSSNRGSVTSKFTAIPRIPRSRGQRGRRKDLPRFVVDDFHVPSPLSQPSRSCVQVTGVSNERITLEFFHMVHRLKLRVCTNKEIDLRRAGPNGHHLQGGEGGTAAHHQLNPCHRRNQTGKRPPRFSALHITAPSTVNTIKHTGEILVYVEFQTETRNELEDETSHDEADLDLSRNRSAWRQQ